MPIPYRTVSRQLLEQTQTLNLEMNKRDPIQAKLVFIKSTASPFKIKKNVDRTQQTVEV
jgi:hypothetical protein